jgi:hypothetical protein
MAVITLRDGAARLLHGLQWSRDIASTPTTTVTNRVWDTVAGGEVRWETASPDSSGASYPGPGTFGVDTSDYTVDEPVSA